MLIHDNLIMMIDRNQGPVLCCYTNKTIVTIVSSMGNKTSTCLMYDSSHNQNNIVSLSFAFKFRLNEARAIALVQAGTQADKFVSAIDCAGNIANFTKNLTRKSFFFSQDSKEMCSLIFAFVIKKL